jgi:hypothetical protein
MLITGTLQKYVSDGAGTIGHKDRTETMNAAPRASTCQCDPVVPINSTHLSDPISLIADDQAWGDVLIIPLLRGRG